jgi:hypothetical protein
MGLRVGLEQGPATLRHARDERSCLPRPNPVACSSSSCVRTPVHVHFSSHPCLEEWQWVSVTAVYGCMLGLFYGLP